MQLDKVNIFFLKARIFLHKIMQIFAPATNLGANTVLIEGFHESMAIEALTQDSKRTTILNRVHRTALIISEI